MIVETLMFAGAALGTLILGAPLALSVARRERWVHTAPRDPSTRKMRSDVVRAYTPLDLGIDPIRWPSERLWELKSTLAIPDWPSRSWNDEHFGRNSKNFATYDASEAGFHAMAARRHREVTASSARATAARTPASQKPRPQAEEKPQSSANRRGARDPKTRAQPVPTPRAVVAPVPVPEPPPATGAPPDAAELEHLIGTVGLAGTVQAIMQRTGWEFREAAQYLARIRRS